MMQGDTVLYIHPGSADGYFGIKTSPAIVLVIHPLDTLANDDGKPMLDLYVLTAPSYDSIGNLLAPGGTYTNLKCFHEKNLAKTTGRTWCYPYELPDAGHIDY